MRYKIRRFTIQGCFFNLKRGYLWIFLAAFTLPFLGGYSCVSLSPKGGVCERAYLKIESVSNQYLYEYVLKSLASDYWVVESVAEREVLPLLKMIEPAPVDQLTKSTGQNLNARLWHRSHGRNDSSRYSELDQINTDNVQDLEVAWIYKPQTGTANIQSNPVIARGVLYTPTGGHDIVALDAKTGRQLWQYSPPEKFPARRGMIYWQGDARHSPRIYFPNGPYLIALNAEDGSAIEGFGKSGIVDSGGTGKIAPAIAGNTIIHATFKPSLAGYDLLSGRLLWETSLLVYGAKKTQGGRPFALKGGNPWGGMALDSERQIAYVTTGDPAPILVGTDRPGRNQHANSVIAIDIRDGTVLWSFQEVRHDLWDLDIPASPILTTITIGNQRVDVVAAVTKLGNTLLLDRLSGKPVFGFGLKRAPTSTLYGEKTWPYQPAVELPEPFSRPYFDLDQITNIGEGNRQAVLAQMDQANYGFFVPHEEGVPSAFFGLHGGAEWTGAAVDQASGILYVSSNQVPYTVSVVNRGPSPDESLLPVTSGRRAYLTYCSGCHGNNREGGVGPSLVWLKLSTDRVEVETIIENGIRSMPPPKGLTSNDATSIIDYLFKRDDQLADTSSKQPKGRNFNYSRTPYRRLMDQEGYPGSKPPWGLLSAIDLNNGKKLWSRPLGEYTQLSERGIAITGTENFGGASVTAGGLVFVSGTLDLKIRAFDKDTGEELWNYVLPFIGSAPPSIYEVDGTEYVVVPATGGGTLGKYYSGVAAGSAFVAFKLPDH
ncbi:MAG: quinoprotein glucose dehydrogenase [Motiliproteus sp.]|jgi:quinoprotein glucose dehydrogenase